MAISPFLPPSALLVGLLALPATAQDATLRREIETALSRAAETGALAGDGKPTTVRSEARIRYELGAVVDLHRAGAGNGLAVLAVTPGSAASRLDLRPGDRLLAINGRGISARTDTLQQAIDAGNGKLAVQWLRAGKRHAAQDRADAVAVPAYQLTVGGRSAAGCGFVSDRQGVVPKSRHVFQAGITRIDGRSTPLAGQFEYELPAGQHVLTIAESIDRSRLSLSQQRQIHLAHRLKTAAQSYKTLVVDVQPNTTYRIGVRLLPERLDEASIRRNAYWEPVVWESRPQTCR